MVRIKNPVIWADVPDNDVIRVGNAFYMVSTSMHSMPGGPIMKSYDLKHWEIVSYMFDRLAEKDGNNLENGCNIYGKGSWAASLRQVGEWFYCLLNSNDDHHAYMFRTKDIEKSGWEKYSLDRYLHDPAILLDDDGRKYVLYGNHDIYILELTDDMLGVKPGGVDRLLLTTETEGIGLKAEGCHAYKIDGKYYAIFIEWPSGGNRRRREVCFRWNTLEEAFAGKVEHRVILDDDMNYHNAGVAQGAIFTLPETVTDEAALHCNMYRGPENSYWSAVLFQDHGAVGRIPYVMPVNWQDGWPMPGIDGWVPENFELPLETPPEARIIKASGNVIMTAADMTSQTPDLVCSLCSDDDFLRMRGEERSLADVKHSWQWNHNPDDTAWSLTERPGWLRLSNSCINDMGILQAKNTLTQRTYGPKCSATTHIDLSGMNPGDSCGMVAIQGQFMMVGTRSDDDGNLSLVVCVNDGKYGEEVIYEEKLERTDIYLRMDFDFEDNRDVAECYRSFDGKRWKKVGKPLQMRYTLDHFMGYRIGLYSYAAQKTRGFADFEYFRWL